MKEKKERERDRKCGRKRTLRGFVGGCVITTTTSEVPVTKVVRQCRVG